MIRKVIEYLRRKQGITIEDLVIEICSSNMYYKYINGTKNISKEKLIQIKERLGAEDISKEEVIAYKNDMQEIIRKIARYYPSKKEFDDDILPIIELENQLLLNEELFLDYFIVKLNYLLIYNDNEIYDLLNLVKSYYEKLSQVNKLHYLKIASVFNVYNTNSLVEETKEFDNVLSLNPHGSDYGCFYNSLALNFVRIKDRTNALRTIETAIQLFQRDLNIGGLVKATNTKSILYIEMERYNDALILLLANYDNIKKIKTKYEVFQTLCNIIGCYIGLKDVINSKKYWKLFKDKFNKNANENIRLLVINNCMMGLLTNFEYFNMEKELCEIIEIIEPYIPVSNQVINNLIQYYKINSIDDKVNYIENILLDCVIGKAQFSYCAWLLDTCIRYFKEKRMYKKATSFETKYLEEFRIYYFYK